ncbi:Protein of unknown function [Bacillus cereus]|jgi:hypothetical protein
MYG